jgi:3-oxoacyl-[acyl-carrier protein] reductase
MQKQEWGRIINITSLSVKEPAESLVLSNVFRSGVVAFAKSISKELIKSNITINNLCPGAFKTDRAKELIAKAAADTGRTPAEVEAENKQKLPLGRYQEPNELGAFVAFLCSDIAGGVTGTTIQIDGGISNGLL